MTDPDDGAPPVAIAPLPAPGWATEVVLGAGARIVPIEEAEALLWMGSGSPGDIFEVLAEARNIRWVHLLWAGVEKFARVGSFDDGRTWTCGKGVFAEPVAEHALALGLAGLRGFRTYLSADAWLEERGASLFERQVTILGGGGIAEALARLLEPFRAHVTVVRRRKEPFPRAERTLTPEHIDEALSGADLVVLALALTPETTGIIDEHRLRLMRESAWLVNVARGAHIVTDDLVRSLREGWIGGAALDVTDPEPLPAGHPLWELENCIITPHSAGTDEMTLAATRERMGENLRRFATGEQLIGVVDPVAGY